VAAVLPFARFGWALAARYNGGSDMPAPEDRESASLLSAGEGKTLRPQLPSLTVQQPPLQQRQQDTGNAPVGFSLQKMSAMAASVSQVDTLRAEAGFGVCRRSAPENQFSGHLPSTKVPSILGSGLAVRHLAPRSLSWERISRSPSPHALILVECCCGTCSSVTLTSPRLCPSVSSHLWCRRARTR